MARGGKEKKKEKAGRALSCSSLSSKRVDRDEILQSTGTEYKELELIPLIVVPCVLYTGSHIE